VRVAALAAATGLAGFLVGALVGIPGQDRSREGDAAHDRAAAAVRAPSVPSARTTTDAIAPAGPTAHDHDHGPTSQVTATGPIEPPAADTSGEAIEDAPRPSLRTLLAAVRAGGAETGGMVADAIAHDPALLQEALELLGSSGDPETLAALAAMLAQAHTPEVEGRALALVTSDDPARRAAALDMLDHFDTPRAIPVVQDILATSGDAETVARALYALPPAEGLAASDTAAITQQLSRLATSAGEPEVRRRALIALGDYGGADSEPVFVEAMAAGDATTRAAAAFALERARARSPEAIAALARALSNPNEDFTVRENAFQALRNAGPLPAQAHRAFQAYLVEREGMGVGDGR
jgi:hypothetical protein